VHLLTTALEVTTPAVGVAALLWLTSVLDPDRQREAIPVEVAEPPQPVGAASQA
jgi:hypothetical protein